MINIATVNVSLEYKAKWAQDADTKKLQAQLENIEKKGIDLKIKSTGSKDVMRDIDGIMMKEKDWIRNRFESEKKSRKELEDRKRAMIEQLAIKDRDLKIQKQIDDAKTKAEKEHYLAIQKNLKLIEQHNQAQTKADREHYLALQRNAQIDQQSSNKKAKLEESNKQYKQQIDYITQLSRIRGVHSDAINNEMNRLKAKDVVTQNDIKNYRNLINIQQELNKQQVGFGATQRIMSGIVGGMGVGQMFGNISTQLQDAYNFEKGLAQVGIAGEKTTAQMRELRGEYYNLSVETGKSARDIIGAAETIIKTGQSFEDAQSILKAAVNLSVAVGEPLNQTAEGLSKILLTLKIDAKEATDVTNKMMSVVNKTPASMFSLQEALKQANAGFGNFIETTSKSGEALERYKQKLLDVELSGSGSMALLGRKGGMFAIYNSNVISKVA